MKSAFYYIVAIDSITLYPSLSMMTPYHIWVIPVARACKWLEFILIVSIVINNVQHTVPAVRDVTIVPPQVAILGYDSIVGLGRGGRKGEGGREEKGKYGGR